MPLIVSVSAAVVDCRSVTVVSAFATCAKVPNTVTLLVPPPVTVSPNPLDTPIRPRVSCSVTVIVSLPVLPVSLRLTPLIAVAWFCPRIAVPGALSCGVPFTVTAIVCGVAVAVDASVAVSTMLSAALEALVSVTLPSVALMSARVPPMVRVFMPVADSVAAPDAVAPKCPLVSASVRLKVAPTPEPASARLIEPRAPALPMPITAVVGAVITGALATATAIDPVPVLPRLSVALIAIVSDGETLSVLDNVASDAFTCTSEPKIVTLVVPSVPMLAPSGLPTVSRPLVSDRVTVKFSAPVWPVSAMLMPAIAVAFPAEVETLTGAVTTGGPFTVTATSNGVALAP